MQCGSEQYRCWISPSLLTLTCILYLCLALTLVSLHPSMKSQSTPKLTSLRYHTVPYRSSGTRCTQHMKRESSLRRRMHSPRSSLVAVVWSETAPCQWQERLRYTINMQSICSWSFLIQLCLLWSNDSREENVVVRRCYLFSTVWLFMVASHQLKSKLMCKVFVSLRFTLPASLTLATQAIGTLEEIVMNNNGMYENEVVALSDAFAANKNLKVGALDYVCVMRLKAENCNYMQA